MLDKEVLERLAQVAARQHGLFSVGQARDLGVSAAMLHAWCQRGWLHHVRRGVYAFAGSPPSRWQPAVAASLAAGPDAVLSHRTAAAIHGFDGVLARPQPELTMPEAHHCRLHGVVVHRTGPVAPADRLTRSGLALTSPARTVVDLGAVFAKDLLGAILDDGAVRRMWTFAEVAAVLERQERAFHGAPALRALLATRLEDPIADSHLEQRVIRQLDPLRPFEVHFQQVLSGVVVIVDVAWPQWRVAAEIDGRSYRATSRHAHDRETRKLNLLAAAGWKVAHLSSTMSPAECVEAVLALMPPEALAG